MDRRHLGFAALTVAVFVCVLAAGAPSSWASAPRQYVLRHPKREHCKSHYLRRVRTVRKRIHHRRKKVRQTVCIFVPPAPPSVPSTQTTLAPPLPPPPPVPNPPTEPKLTATVTTLDVPSASEEACSVKTVVGESSILCVYSVKLNVSSVEGQPLTLPLPTLTFSNPGEPGKAWTLSSNGDTSFPLEIYWEHLTTFDVEATKLIDPRYGVFASAPGKGRWSVYASYAGTSAFASSQSSLQSFASPFF